MALLGSQLCGVYLKLTFFTFITGSSTQQNWSCGEHNTREERGTRCRSSRLKSMCSENTPEIYMRTPMPKCALWHGCSPVNLLYIFRTPFLKTSLDGCFCRCLLGKRLFLRYFNRLKSVVGPLIGQSDTKVS